MAWLQEFLRNMFFVLRIETYGRPCRYVSTCVHNYTTYYKITRHSNNNNNNLINLSLWRCERSVLVPSAVPLTVSCCHCRAHWDNYRDTKGSVPQGTFEHVTFGDEAKSILFQTTGQRVAAVIRPYQQ